MAKKQKKVQDETRVQNGALGGQTTFKRYGSEHFSELSKSRKTFAGGRPPNKRKKKK